MGEHPYYNQEAHGPYELVDVGDLPLAAGGTLSQCQLAVATHGTLNAARDNAILVPTWYSGTSRAIEQVFVGPGRTLDPERYFIIIVNQIGGGLSTSPLTYGGAPNKFPKVSISDDVRAQHTLITQYFKIERLAMIFGGSMGGQQAFEWGARYPDAVARLGIVAATPSASGYFQALLGAMMQSLNVADNDTKAALRAHARLWAAVGWGPQFYQTRRYEALGYPSLEGFLETFMDGYFAPMDIHALRCMTDKARTASMDKDALAQISAHCLIMPINTDQVFPVDDFSAAQSLLPGGRLELLTSTDGHLSLFGTDPALVGQIDTHVSALLANES